MTGNLQRVLSLRLEDKYELFETLDREPQDLDWWFKAFPQAYTGMAEMGRANNHHPCRDQSPSLPGVCAPISNVKEGPGWNQSPHYQAPGTRDPVEVPISLEYSPSACEKNPGPKTKKDFLEGTKHL